MQNQTGNLSKEAHTLMLAPSPAATLTQPAPDNTMSAHLWGRRQEAQVPLTPGCCKSHQAQRKNLERHSGKCFEFSAGCTVEEVFGWLSVSVKAKKKEEEEEVQRTQPAPSPIPLIDSDALQLKVLPLECRERLHALRPAQRYTQHLA